MAKKKNYSTSDIINLYNEKTTSGVKLNHTDKMYNSGNGSMVDNGLRKNKRTEEEQNALVKATEQRWLNERKERQQQNRQNVDSALSRMAWQNQALKKTDEIANDPDNQLYFSIQKMGKENKLNRENEEEANKKKKEEQKENAERLVSESGKNGSNTVGTNWRENTAGRNVGKLGTIAEGNEVKEDYISLGAGTKKEDKKAKTEADMAEYLSDIGLDNYKKVKRLIEVKKEISNANTAGRAAKGGQLYNEYKTLLKELREAGVEVDSLIGDDYNNKSVVEQYVQYFEDKQRQTEKLEKDKEEAKNNPIVSELLNIATSPFSGLAATADTIKQKVTNPDKDAPLNLYSDAKYYSNYENEIVGEIAKNTYSKVYDKTGSEALAYIASTGYQILDSTAKSEVNKVIGLVMSQTFGSLGAGKNAVKALTNIVTLPMFGSSAFSSTLKDKIEEGTDQDKAILTATAAGINEMATEIASLDIMLDIFNKRSKGVVTLAKTLANYFGGAAVEGSEEGFNDLLNLVADYVINRDESEYMKNVKLYGEKEAAKMFWSNLGQSVIGGFASGLLMTGTATLAGKVNYTSEAKNLKANTEEANRFVEEVKQIMPEESTAAKIVEGKTGDELSTSDMAKVIESVAEEYGGDTKESLAQKLEEKGIDKKEAEDQAERLTEMLKQNPETTDEAVLEENEKWAEAHPEASETYGEYIRGASALGQAQQVAAEVKAEKIDKVVEPIKDAAVKFASTVQSVTGNGVYRNADAKYEGKDTGVIAFVESKDGKNMVKLRDGRTVELDDVDIVGNAATVYHNASEMENNSGSYMLANAFITYADPQYSQKTMAEAGYFIFNQAAMGVKQNEAVKRTKEKVPGANVLPTAYLYAAYNTGMKQETERPVAVERQGTGKFTTKANISDSERTVYESIAKTLGIDIELNDTITDSNGRIVENAGGKFLNSLSKISVTGSEALGHEVMEMVYARNKKGYDRIQNFLYDAIADDERLEAIYQQGIRKTIEVYKKEKPNFNTVGALKEFANDAISYMLHTEEGLRATLEFAKSRMDEKELKSMGMLMAEAFDEIAKNLKEFVGANPGHQYAKIYMEDADRAEKLRDIVFEVLGETLDKEQAKTLGDVLSEDPKTAHDAAVEIIGEEMYPAEQKEENEVEFSLKLDEKLMESAKKKNVVTVNGKKQTVVSPLVLSRAEATRKRIKLEMEKYTQYLPADIEGNIFVSNGSYSRSGENSLECVRSIVSNNFMDMVSEILDRPMSVEEQLIASQILAEVTGNQRECSYCYVATDRRTYRAMFNEYYRQYENTFNDVQENRAEYEKNRDYGYQKFLNGRKDTSNMRDRYAKFVEEGLKGEKSISISDLATEERRAVDKNKRNNRGYLLRDAEKWAKGAAWPKNTKRTIKVNGERRTLKYIAYNGNILGWKEDLIDRLNSGFGLRLYSDSDYVPAFLLENMQVITDASIRKLKMLSYTKDIGFAKVFAPTGMGINVSTYGVLMKGYENDEELNNARQKYKENNTEENRREYLAKLEKWVESDAMMGAEWEDAKEVRSYSPNVGIVFVATNDDMVEWSLAQDWIDVVIPYHLVRTGDQVAAFFGYKNYKSQQEDKKTNQWEEGNLKSIPPTIHENDREAYFKALEQNNLTARFADWVDNPNYMKLVNETRMSYREMEAVQPIFDLQAALEEVKRIPAEGTYGLLQGINDEEQQKEILSSYAEKAAKTIKGEESEYDLDVPFELEDTDPIEDLSDYTSILEESFDTTSIKPGMIQNVAREIKKQTGTTLTEKEIKGQIEKLFAYMEGSGKVSMDDVIRVMKDIARPIIENVENIPEEQKQLYKTFTDEIKARKIRLDVGQMQEVESAFGSYSNYKRMLRGAAEFSKDGSTLDSIWTEICDKSYGMLDYGTNPNDQPIALLEAIDALKPQSYVLEGQTLDDASMDLALEIFRQFFVAQSKTEANKEAKKKLVETATKLKDSMNERAKKQREDYKARYQERVAELERQKKLNIDRLTEEIRSMSEEERAAKIDGNLLLEASLSAQKKEYQDRLEKLRSQSFDKIAKIDAEHRATRAQVAERRKKTEAKAKLNKEIKELQNLIAHPGEKSTQHIPVDMINATIDMLKAINLDNGRNKAVAERLAKMSEVYKGMETNPETAKQYAKDAEDYAKRTKNVTLSQHLKHIADLYRQMGEGNIENYDERTAADIEELRNMFEGRTYDDLTVPELNRVIEIVKALRQQAKITNNLLLNGKYREASQASSDAVREIRESRTKDSKVLDVLNAYANKHLNAYGEFRKLSGYQDGALMSLYKGFDEGQMKAMMIQKELNEMFSPVLEGKENQKAVKDFISTKNLVNIGTDAHPVMVTKAMRMSLIMHSFNESNMRHVAGSGIRIPNMDLFRSGNIEEAYAKGSIYRFVDYKALLDAMKSGDAAKVEELTKSANQRIEKMQEDLSDWEKSFLEIAKKMFHEETGKHINMTSMATRGYAIARVKNYFPIRTDSRFNQSDWSGLVKDGSLEGMGMLKERKISKNPIILEDITSAIQRQIRNVSQYAGMTIPLRNFNMVLNMTTTDEETGRMDNMKSAIDEVWGSNDTEWLRNLVQDLQMGRAEKGYMLTKMRGAFAGATLSLNPSVAIKQAASYPTAAAVVGYGPLLKAVKDMGRGFASKEGIKELEDINPLLWYRNQGNATQDIADAKSSDLFKKLPIGWQKALNWTQFMDTGTVRTLEYAAKSFVDENFTNLEKGSEEYWDKVNEVFTEVVERTQPNYTKLQQADIIRNPNSFVKQLVMFKTQPMQNFGIVYDAVGEFSKRAAEYKANKSEANKKALDESGKRLARAITSQLIAAATFSAMTMLANGFLHRLYKYRDDEGKADAEKIFEEFSLGIISCMAGSVLGGSVLYELLSNIILKKGQFYGVEVSVVEMLNDLFENIKIIYSNADKLIDSVTDADQEKYSLNLAKSTFNMGTSVAAYFGIPANNIKNILQAIYFGGKDVVEGIKNGSFSVSMDYDIFKTDLESQYDKLWNALESGDMEEYQRLADQNVEAGKKETTATTQMKSRMKEKVTEGEMSEDEAIKLQSRIGIDNDTAYFNVQRWESGINSDYGDMYKKMEDAFTDSSGANISSATSEVKGLLNHGKELKDIKKQIKSRFKDDYLEAKDKGVAADMNAVILRCLEAAGMTTKEAKDFVASWE